MTGIIKASNATLHTAIIIATASIASCSSDNPIGDKQSYDYCITANNTCLAGSFTVDACNGQVSNSCPYGDSFSSSSVSIVLSSNSSVPFSSSSAALESSSSYVYPSSSGGNVSSSSVGSEVVVTPSSSSSSSAPQILYGELTYHGQTYKTVKIGTQTWMAENLNYEVNGSKCYNNEPANCAIYGRLYDWATAMDIDPSCNFAICRNQSDYCSIRGICPQGSKKSTKAT